MNTICLTGRLTRDPELRALPDVTPLCFLRLAVDGGRDRDPVYIDVTTFGAGAEACARYLAKGRYVEVEGRLRYNEWEAKDGTRRSKHEVIGRVQFGPDRPRESDEPATDGEQDPDA